MKLKISIMVIVIICSLLIACKVEKKDLADDNSITEEANTTQPSNTAEAEITAAQLDADASYAEYNFDISGKFQQIDGFGAAYTWYSDMINQAEDPEGAYDALFSDAKLTVLRFKNEYEYHTDDFAGNTRTMLQYYQAAKKRANAYGEEPIVLMSSWSPPARLKTDNDISGKATLRKDENGNYCYEEYAEWWVESLEYYKSQGIEVDFVSIQNEADFAASYDGCRLEPIETEDAASYAKAYLAVYHAFKDRFGSAAPKMIGPETMSLLFTTVNYYMKDIIDTEPESIYGLAHHLYIGGESDAKTNRVDPGSFIINMMDLKSRSNGYKMWQTEFYIGNALETALLINNSMTYEEANAYLFWSGTWINESEDFEAGYLMGLKRGLSDGITRTGWRLSANYYAIRHFSEFVRPGYTRIKATTKDRTVSTSAYMNSDATKVVLVLINTNTEEKKYRITGNNYTILTSSIYQSIFGDESVSDEHCFKNLGNLGENNEINLPAKSVTTIDITGK
ncbi:MAG: xynC [Herbinix sp.]|jgi:O-glycosyl hydrolase|nr:xynC [Herbinix sp.]